MEVKTQVTKISLNQIMVAMQSGQINGPEVFGKYILSQCGRDDLASKKELMTGETMAMSLGLEARYGIENYQEDSLPEEMEVRISDDGRVIMFLGSHAITTLNIRK